MAAFSSFATQPPAPSMALLEYLATMVEVEGELVGPMDMEKPQLKAQQQVKDKAQQPAPSSAKQQSSKQEEIDND